MLNLKEAIELAHAVKLVYKNDPHLPNCVSQHDIDRLRSIETDEMMILADAVIEADLKE
jgi:hypothetical protein